MFKKVMQRNYLCKENSFQNAFITCNRFLGVGGKQTSPKFLCWDEEGLVGSVFNLFISYPKTVPVQCTLFASKL